MPKTPLSSNRLPRKKGSEDSDELEFEAFVESQDPIIIAAASWAVRKRNGLNAQDYEKFEAWINADPRHAGAFEDMNATIDNVGQMSADDVAMLKAGVHSHSRSTAMAARATAPSNGRAECLGRCSDHPTWLPWRLNLGTRFPRAAAATMLIAVLGSGWMGWEHWRQLPTFEQAYVTERGQHLAINLPDGETEGSTLLLDTATKAEVRLYRDRREVYLTSGQAMFTVQSDPQRPFHVRAGNLRITVVGTRFSVRQTHTGLDAGQTVVSVEEGRVRVARAEVAEQREKSSTGNRDGDVPPLDLLAGQMVVAGTNGSFGKVVNVPPATIAQWRNGRLSFDQTPLAEAIAEFERYGRTGLIVRDPAVAAMPVGGSYGLRHFQHFAESLPRVLPVQLVARGEVIEVIARQK